MSFSATGFDTRIQAHYSTSYHDELTGLTSGYTSGGTYTVELTQKCFLHSIVCMGGNDVVYLVVDSADATTDLADKTERFKLLATTTGTRYDMYMEGKTLDFDIEGTATLSIYVDSFR